VPAAAKIRGLRILVCASEAPLPPLNGMRLQLRALVGQLARRHDVTVLCFRWPGQTGLPPEGVEQLDVTGPAPGRAASTGERLLALARREPIEVRRLCRPMADEVRRLRARMTFDVAHVSLGPLAGIAPALTGLPAVIAPLDAWELNVRAEQAGATGVEAIWRRAQADAVRRYTSRAYRPFAATVLVSEQDAALTRAADPALRVEVIPNGVDAAHFAPDGGAVEPATLLFTGVLRTPANEQAAIRLAERVLPAVRARIPQARLVLAGRTPSERVNALAKLPGVEVVADAPDLRPLLRSATVFGCAMESGTGIKNKLLEAMACGAAAVATPLAVQGLSTRDGEELLVADDRFADAVVRVLADPELRARLGTAARAYVEREHSWEAVARAYEALYEDARTASSS
jgi:polysaccharide biosynthesis protein PslH